MRSLIKTLTTLLALSLPQAALADGQYAMYTPDGDSLGLLEIVGDVSPELVLFTLADHGIQIYVPPEAAYVTIDTTNPWIDTTTQYKGWWVSTDDDYIKTCDTEIADHDAVPRTLWGDVVWTNTALDDALNITFTIDVSVCDGDVMPWATTEQRAAAPLPPYTPSCSNDWAGAAPTVAGPRATEAETATCTSAGGAIQRVGIRQNDACIMPQCDAGQVCSDSSECVGRCLAGDGFDAVRGDPIAMTGYCQPTTSNFGCTTEITAGLATMTLCMD